MSRLLVLIAVLWSAVVAGCASVPTVSNPVFISTNNPEAAWERTVDAIHDFRFPVLRENKLDGVIETDYVVGSNIFEVWNRDSVGCANRFESTFQSIRRRAFVTVAPAPGGFYVTVEALKELESTRGPVANSAGGATFQVDNPLQRDLNLVVGQAVPSGWIGIGRDYELEQAMLRRIRARF